MIQNSFNIVQQDKKPIAIAAGAAIVVGVAVPVAVTAVGFSTGGVVSGARPSNPTSKIIYTDLYYL